MENTFTCRVILANGSIIRIKDAENYLHVTSEKVFIVDGKNSRNVFNESFVMGVLNEDDLMNK